MSEKDTASRVYAGPKHVTKTEVVYITGTGNKIPCFNDVFHTINVIIYFINGISKIV